MNAAGTVVASMIAASTVALTTSSLAFASSNQKESKSGVDYCSYSSASAASCAEAVHKGKGKFEPRFDGMRFIETLITAHR